MHAARNVAKAFLLLGGFVALFTALGWWLGGVRLAGVFFVVCLLMSATLHWYGPRIVLASLGARELTLAGQPFSTRRSSGSRCGPESRGHGSTS